MKKCQCTGLSAIAGGGIVELVAVREGRDSDSRSTRSRPLAGNRPPPFPKHLLNLPLPCFFPGSLSLACYFFAFARYIAN